MNGAEDSETLKACQEENMRLEKLAAERASVISKLKMRLNEKLITTEDSGASATRISSLSKKVRDMSASLESEKNKSKQWAKKCMELEIQMETINLRQNIEDHSPEYKNTSAKVEEKDHEQLLQLREKYVELQNQHHNLKLELKVAHKVISSEVGEDVPIASLMNTTSGWRGRSQQIAALRTKVKDLQSQVDETSMRRDASTDRQRELLSKLSNDKKMQALNLSEKLASLEKEYNELKMKYDSSVSRNKTLSVENRENKKQTSMLLEKSKHDDELVDALLKQQENLKSAIQANAKSVGCKVVQNPLAETIEHLQKVIAEKEALLRANEEKIDLLVEEKAAHAMQLPTADLKLKDVEEMNDSQIRALYLVTRQENDKLLQIMQSTRQRLDAEVERRLDAETECQKLKASHGSCPSESERPRNSARNCGHSSKNKQNLEEKCELLEDEVASLKEALRSTLQSKEQDARLFNDIINETKAIFLAKS